MATKKIAKIKKIATKSKAVSKKPSKKSPQPPLLKGEKKADITGKVD